MVTLRAQIQGLRCPVAKEAKSFVPHQDLYRLLTKSVIREALSKGASTRWYNLDQVVDIIHSGGRRIFAILTVLNGQEQQILRFIEHDHFQGSPLDHKLPFSRTALSAIVPDIAIDFYEKQWEFSAPVLARGIDHRLLDDFTALPFTENRKIDEGGFGEVFKIILHESHQDLSLISPTNHPVLVRKQFPEIISDEDLSHERELYNLSLLNQLKHPNILELLTFYTYQRRRNFIFPFAKDGNLEDLFKNDCRPAQFKQDFAFYRALSGLSSGIMEMHSYATEQTLDLKLIGLHHDLKPDNVLVDDKLFILADFGLSTFKRSSQPSTSPFRMGGNDYVAPECEDLEHGFKKGTYNRSSDMWSFGCILAEVLTYMLHGGPGILEFRNRRGFKVNGWKLHTFHSCRANKVEVNEHVLQWLAEMEKSASLPGKQFIELIRKILSVVQEDRPTAVEVTQKLRFIAINEVLLPLAEQYNLTVSRVKSIQARLECERFRSWGHILGFINDECSSEQRAMVFELDFQSSITLLQETDAELRLIESRYDAATHPLFHELSRLNDKLMALLPEHMRKKARSYLELRVLSDISVETSDPESLGHLASLNGRGGMLSFIKRMTVLSVNRSRALALERAKKGKPDLRVETQAVELGTPFDDHCLAMIDDKSNPKKNVLIEWIKYDTHWEGPVETEMMNRVENITAYLNETAVSTQPLRLLHCIGYFHSIAEHAFGLVFELPYTIPKTLSTIISETRGTLDPPHLGDRFFLASTLASTLLDLHMATFYHKSIASHNIIFTSNNRPLLRDFHLIGFNHIRPTDPKAFTEGPPSSLNARRYQHPSYTTEAMRRGERFRLEYDYYSLGLVLLEIGLWDSVAGVKARSASELMEILLRKRVPLLGHCVGTAFREAVAKCMRGDFGRTEDLSSDNDVILEYEQVVVEPLRRLVA